MEQIKPKKAVLIDLFGREYPLKDSTSIGRANNNDLIISSFFNAVSRKHAKIDYVAERGKYVLYDLESKFGTDVYYGNNPGKNCNIFFTELENNAKIALGCNSNSPFIFTYEECN